MPAIGTHQAQGPGRREADRPGGEHGEHQQATRGGQRPRDSRPLEGDLIIGKNGASAVETLVERMTRYLLLLNLPNDHGALAVEEAMRNAIATLPAELARSITWDQGSEMASHLSFTTATGIPIYFCDPHSPWQRGSNENTNGLPRQYLPKSTDLSVHTADDLLAIQRSLNGRPRKTLGYKMREEKLAEIVALST